VEVGRFLMKKLLGLRASLVQIRSMGEIVRGVRF